MNDKSFHLIAGAIFALVALGHILRIYFGWPAVIGGWSAPMWLSWLAAFVAASLTFFAFSQKAQR